ncbi:NUDIX hydrolase [Mangrovihabitans endophyticus]|uniref:Putative hydrolase MutT/NUDIX n=1 Tax=Mangrovihabitans endophyticus TaxID=1751298 RepID=A0A8J3FRE7_9ACTN|nr:NUDIX hydrolase [Mangrovihabitans endophyticus]GGL10965.1 putative hydrolase MutT/NUDIX [Mangrovihabitans endophyticus]
MADPVRAAGGVLWRPASSGGIEVCLVHRPLRQDWSLPKGKLDEDEHPLAAGVREVLEETGWRGRPEVRLPSVAYDLPDGRGKTVDFWLMRAAADQTPGPADPAEVDDVAWLPPAEAALRLSYPTDRAVLEHAVTLPPVTAVTALVRHAHAGERKKWVGNDALRPIDARGLAQAERIGAVVELIAPTRLFAAPPLRCKQTLEPLAGRLDLPIVADSAFAEPSTPDEAPARVKAAAARLSEVRDADRTAICSQGKVIPPLLASLHDEDDPQPYKTPKGAGWILAWSGDQLVASSRI